MIFLCEAESFWKELTTEDAEKKEHVRMLTFVNVRSILKKVIFRFQVDDFLEQSEVREVLFRVCLRKESPGRDDSQ